MSNLKHAKERIHMSSITEKAKKQKQVLTLNKLSKRKVVEHNDLITSIAKMDKTPLKMFELAISCIDTENPPKDNTVYLSKRELFAFFKVSDNDKHSRFKQSIRSMQKEAYFEIKENKGKGFDFESIIPIPYVKWNDYNDEVTIRFDQAIMPYLINLKKNFTQHALSDISELNSKYSIILYRWLSMNYNQYEHYANKGGRRQNQLSEYCNPEIKVAELRTMTDTIKEYKETYHFFRYVVENSLKEISKHTHFNVTYEKIKKGRSIIGIQFNIEKKKKVTAPVDYKENDPISQKYQQDKEENEDQLLGLAMQSPYTKLLLEQLLINQYDLIDKKVMVGLQRTVFPKYEELTNLKDRNSVKEHIQYVAAHRIPSTTKENIVNYLKAAIENYLVNVKTNNVFRGE
mgnify:CR=1 FL=1